MKSYINFVNEAIKKRFKEGDVVVCVDNAEDLDCKDQFGVITNMDYADDIEDDQCTIKFFERFDEDLHDGNGEDDTDSSWHMSTNILKRMTKKAIEKYELKKQKELDKKKKLCKRYKDIDPYAEEDWTKEEKERKLKKKNFENEN